MFSECAGLVLPLLAIIGVLVLLLLGLGLFLLRRISVKLLVSLKESVSNAVMDSAGSGEDGGASTAEASVDGQSVEMTATAPGGAGGRGAMRRKRSGSATVRFGILLSLAVAAFVMGGISLLHLSGIISLF